MLFRETDLTTFRAGAQEMGRFAFALFTWGLVTGVAIAQSPFSLTEAAVFSLVVFAGSAQLAVLPLIFGGAPLWTILLTAAIVNLRFVVFSAALQPHFGHLPFVQRAVLGYLNGDLPHVLFIRRYGEVASSDGKLQFYLGLVFVNWMVWHGSSLLGIFCASVMPSGWGLGFAGNLALIAVLVPMLDKRAALIAAAFAGIVAVATIAAPYRLNILCSVGVAVGLGMVLEARLRRSAEAM